MNRKALPILFVAPLALALPVGAALGDAPDPDYRAAMEAVPHTDDVQDVTGDATIRLNGNSNVISVDLSASGLTPNEPHAMHIHGVLEAMNECPGVEADTDGDGLISLQEGAPSYGPIQVSLTDQGKDTSAENGLTLEDFVVASEDGELDYQRTFRVSDEVIANLADLHIVIHGADIDGNGTSLEGDDNLLFEATLPASCGELN